MTLQGQAGVTTVLGTYYINFWRTPGRMVPPSYACPGSFSSTANLHPLSSSASLRSIQKRIVEVRRKMDEVVVVLMGKVAPPNMDPWWCGAFGIMEWMRERERERGISNGISWKEFLCPVRNWIESRWRLHVITTKHTHTHTLPSLCGIPYLIIYGGLEWQLTLVDLDNTHWMLFMGTFLNENW